MKKENTLKKYIARLSDLAWEKSIYGDEAASLYYFSKAVDAASSPDEYMTIAVYMQKADLPDNKSLAYGIFMTALEKSVNPVKYFKHLLHRRDLTILISEYVIKMPDDLFHFLVNRTKNQDQIMFLCSFFKPLSHFITDPDPDKMIGDAA